MRRNKKQHNSVFGSALGRGRRAWAGDKTGVRRNWIDVDEWCILKGPVKSRLAIGRQANSLQGSAMPTYLEDVPLEDETWGEWWIRALDLAERQSFDVYDGEMAMTMATALVIIFAMLYLALHGLRDLVKLGWKRIQHSES